MSGVHVVDSRLALFSHSVSLEELPREHDVDDWTRSFWNVVNVDIEPSFRKDAFAKPFY